MRVAGYASTMMRSATRWTDRVIGERRLRRAGVVVATALVLPSVAVSATISATADFPPGYAAHHTYAEARATLRDLAATHPAIVQLSNIGRSHEGRKLFVVKISDNARREEPEPEVYIDGGIHGHEHLSTEQTLAVIDWLVDGYAADARILAIVDSTEIWIAPLVNPDGATFDISGGSFHRWRKNRQPNGAGQAVATGRQPQLRLPMGLLRRVECQPTLRLLPRTRNMVDAGVASDSRLRARPDHGW